jgi:hypothetical protein
MTVITNKRNPLLEKYLQRWASPRRRRLLHAELTDPTPRLQPPAWCSIPSSQKREPLYQLTYTPSILTMALPSVTNAALNFVQVSSSIPVGFLRLVSPALGNHRAQSRSSARYIKYTLTRSANAGKPRYIPLRYPSCCRSSLNLPHEIFG